MKELSKIAKTVYAILLEEVNNRKLIVSLADMMFDRRDLVQFVIQKDKNFNHKDASRNKVDKAITELINCGILLQMINGNLRIADPADIVRQRMNRGSYIGNAPEVP